MYYTQLSIVVWGYFLTGCLKLVEWWCISKSQGQILLLGQREVSCLHSPGEVVRSIYVQDVMKGFGDGCWGTNATCEQCFQTYCFLLRKKKAAQFFAVSITKMTGCLCWHLAVLFDRNVAVARDLWMSHLQAMQWCFNDRFFVFGITGNCSIFLSCLECLQKR